MQVGPMLKFEAMYTLLTFAKTKSVNMKHVLSTQ